MCSRSHQLSISNAQSQEKYNKHAGWFLAKSKQTDVHKGTHVDAKHNRATGKGLAHSVLIVFHQA